jgi:hypothetical protein
LKKRDSRLAKQLVTLRQEKSNLEYAHNSLKNLFAPERGVSYDQFDLQVAQKKLEEFHESRGGDGCRNKRFKEEKRDDDDSE